MMSAVEYNKSETEKEGYNVDTIYRQELFKFGDKEIDYQYTCLLYTSISKTAFCEYATWVKVDVTTKINSIFFMILSLTVCNPFVFI